MTLAEAIRETEAFLDYEGNAERFDPATLQAVEKLLELARGVELAKAEA